MTTLREAAAIALAALSHPNFQGAEEAETILRDALEKSKSSLKITTPNEAGSTLVTARWFVDTPHGWIGAWDRDALEYVIGKKK